MNNLPDFAKAPLLVFWETTKACPLSCRHCRASAIRGPLPDELTHDEGAGLISDVAGFGSPGPVLVLTGGDCLMRMDISELISQGKEAGLKIAISPAVSPLLTEAKFAQFLQMGVKSVSLSLDGSTPGVHDSIRGVEGHFEQTLAAARLLVDMGFSVQVNTTVMPANAGQMADIALLLKEAGVRIWEVFFLVSVGRGEELEELTAQQNEDVCNFLADMTGYGFVVRTVEAPFFRRIMAERASGNDTTAFHGELYSELSKRSRELLGEPFMAGSAARVSTRDGKGIVFISHNGDVYPSGFLPSRVGNIRSGSIVDIYRNSETLLALRKGEFEGRCGVCEYRDICGGSRSRAYSRTGNILDEDPGCIYVPAALRGSA